MKYEQYQYLWPPRPEHAIPKALLPVYEKRGFSAQIKMNGSCSVIFVPTDKNVIFKTRHDSDHRAWGPNDDSTKIFKELSGSGWYVFVAELLHSKTPHLKNIHYIHDILVLDSEYLIGEKQSKRQEILHSLFLKEKKVIEKETHFVLNENTWLTKEFKKEFIKLFELLDTEECEGLVVKNPEATLQFCSRQSSNQDWQVKVRKNNKNFTF